MRVLQVYPQLNNAGTEMVIMNLYRNIDRNKVQFDFLVQEMGELDPIVKKMGAQIYQIPCDKKYKENLKKFFEKHKEYDVVHTHMHKAMGSVLKEAANAGVPCRIAHSHNARTDLPNFIKFYKMITGYKIEKYATHFLACSEEAAQWLFPRKHKMSVVWKNAIEMERFVFSEEIRKKIREELGIPATANVICHVGRFAEQKNHKRIISILNDIMNSDQNIYAVLVGVGPLLDEIKQMAQTSKIKFLGNRTDVPDILCAADLFLFPSLYEGLGIVAIEAQTSGLYCIASTNVPESADLGTGCFQRINLSEDNKKWEEAIQTYLKKVGIEERRKKALSALETEYNIEVIAKKVEKFYLKLGGNTIDERG